MDIIVSRLPIHAMPGINFECCTILGLDAGPTPIAVLNADLWETHYLTHTNLSITCTPE